MTLPPADSISIAKDGSIWIVPQGGDPAQPQQVDKLKLVSPTGSQIAKGVDGLFREVNGGALPEDPEASVTAGAGRFKRESDGVAGPDDRGQPRMGNADQADHYRQGTGRQRRQPAARSEEHTSELQSLMRIS